MGKKSDKTKGKPEKAKSEKVKEKPAAKKAAKAPVTAAAPVAPETPAKPKPKPKAKKVVPPTFDEIQLQAYFVSERRLAAGLPGDTASDWIQAEQELLAARS